MCSRCVNTTGSDVWIQSVNTALVDDEDFSWSSGAFLFLSDQPSDFLSSLWHSGFWSCFLFPDFEMYHAFLSALRSAGLYRGERDKHHRGREDVVGGGGQSLHHGELKHKQTPPFPSSLAWTSHHSTLPAVFLREGLVYEKWFNWKIIKSCRDEPKNRFRSTFPIPSIAASYCF